MDDFYKFLKQTERNYTLANLLCDLSKKRIEAFGKVEYEGLKVATDYICELLDNSNKELGE